MTGTGSDVITATQINVNQTSAVPVKKASNFVGLLHHFQPQHTVLW
jgi:hypothetical protein